MDESVVEPKPEMNANARRRWRLRFRITTLLWLMVVMTAFFCGRQSVEIQSAVTRWWQVTRVRWGWSVTKTEIVSWPPGSITINEPNPIQNATVNDPQVMNVAFLAANQMQISPKGKTSVSYLMTSGKHRSSQFVCNVEHGRIEMDWTHSQQ